jgi:hypothetical protein
VNVGQAGWSHDHDSAAAGLLGVASAGNASWDCGRTLIHGCVAVIGAPYLGQGQMAGLSSVLSCWA